MNTYFGIRFYLNQFCCCAKYMQFCVINDIKDVTLNLKCLKT